MHATFNASSLQQLLSLGSSRIHLLYTLTVYTYTYIIIYMHLLYLHHRLLYGNDIIVNTTTGLQRHYELVFSIAGDGIGDLY